MSGHREKIFFSVFSAISVVKFLSKNLAKKAGCLAFCLAE
jgi:hypothetical protein